MLTKFTKFNVNLTKVNIPYARKKYKKLSYNVVE